MILKPKKDFQCTLDRGNYTYYSFAVIDKDQDDKEFREKYLNEKTVRIEYARRFLVDQVCMEVLGKTFDQMISTKPNHVKFLLKLNQNFTSLVGVLPPSVRYTQYQDHVRMDLYVSIIERGQRHSDWNLQGQMKVQLLSFICSIGK